MKKFVDMLKAGMAAEPPRPAPAGPMEGFDPEDLSMDSVSPCRTLRPGLRPVEIISTGHRTPRSWSNQADGLSVQQFNMLRQVFSGRTIESAIKYIAHPECAADIKAWALEHIVTDYYIPQGVTSSPSMLAISLEGYLLRRNWPVSFAGNLTEIGLTVAEALGLEITQNGSARCFLKI